MLAQGRNPPPARVYTVLKLDERRDKAQTLQDKVTSVERVLAAEE